MKSINHTVNIACEHLESIGCDGNAIELRETIAALVAVAEAASNLLQNTFGNFTPNEKKVVKALANLAAVQGGAK